ncbi:hypothetical protein D3C74_30200 [compost metagenome]
MSLPLSASCISNLYPHHAESERRSVRATVVTTQVLQAAQRYCTAMAYIALKYR